jgi:perosamine synthetase
MFVTDDSALYETVLTLSNHGRARNQDKQFWPDVVGFKYKISNIQAAIGCAQLERVDELVNRKRQIFQEYLDRLGLLPGVSMNPEPAGTQNGFWMPTAVFAPFTGVSREDLRSAFAAQQIDARVFFWPLSSLPMFDGVQANIHARSLPGRAINLPSFHDMSETDIATVSAVVIACLRK